MVRLRGAVCDIRRRAEAEPAPCDGSRQKDFAASRTLFTAEHGGSVVSWDRCDKSKDVVVVHRLANAMLAEIVLLAADRDGEPPAAPLVIARDGRVEYSKPQAAFVSDGRLVARLNLASGSDEAGGMPRDVTHGLWLLDARNVRTPADLTSKSGWAPLHVDASLGEHGTYDVCSSSYANAHGVREGFILDPTRNVLVCTARSHDPALGMSDRLYLVTIPGLVPAPATIPPKAPIRTSAKGCHVPVAFSFPTLVYHFRSPTEAGDLWATQLDASAAVPDVSEASAAPSAPAVRRTFTMPVSLRAKLTPPEELLINGRHALLYRPPTSDTPSPAIVWAHGGPMAAFAYDYNPIASWLASLGYGPQPISRTRERTHALDAALLTCRGRTLLLVQSWWCPTLQDRSASASR
jgi:hypothetical protein